MTFQASLVSGMCRIYSVLLYTYPREFRTQFGGEMQQVFRDRLRDIARTRGGTHWLRFAVQTAGDWLTSTVRERATEIWSVGRKPAPRNAIAEWAVTILVYLFAATTLVQAYVVPTGSMEGNIRVGDHMLVDRLAYSDPGTVGRHLLPYRDVDRGDIVAFVYPEDIRQTYVKRVIGLPGDRIRLVNKQVIRNGSRLIEPYTQHISVYRNSYRDDFPQEAEGSTTPRGREMLAQHVVSGEVVVPPNALFVMGDNRDNSEDSRYWGFVPREYVVGKPLVVYWSYDAPTNELTEWSMGHVWDVALHFFTKTRWERTLLVPKSQRAEEVGGGE